MNIDILEKLIPNVLTVVVQLCATGVLFLLLKKFAWQPTKNILDQRRTYEQERLTEAERLRQENEELKQQMEQKLLDADKQAQQKIQQAQQKGKKLQEQLVQEGKDKSQQLLSETQENIELRKNKMLEEMHDDIVDVAISATEKMLNEKLDKKSDEALIDDFIKEVSKK